MNGGINASLQVWKYSALKLSGSGLILVRRLLMTSSISVGVIVLFKLTTYIDLTLSSGMR